MLLEELQSEIEQWLKKVGIENYTIHDNGVVDVDDDVNLHNKKLTRIPVQFGIVTGDFACTANQLTSLKGAPREVGGSFFCSSNKLISLEHGPKEVGGRLFNCTGNNLTTLEGAPREVGGTFLCSNNQLTTLRGAPREVGGTFNCTHNYLKTLQGAPREIGGDFECWFNEFGKRKPDHSFIKIGGKFLWKW